MCDCVIPVPVMLDEAMEYLENRQVSVRPYVGSVKLNLCCDFIVNFVVV